MKNSARGYSRALELPALVVNNDDLTITVEHDILLLRVGDVLDVLVLDLSIMAALEG